MSKPAGEEVKNYGWENFFSIPVPHCSHSPSHNIGEVVVKTNQFFNGRDDAITIKCEDQYPTRTSTKPVGHVYTIELKDPKSSQIAFRRFSESRDLPSERFSHERLVIQFGPVKYQIKEGLFCSSTDF